MKKTEKKHLINFINETGVPCSPKFYYNLFQKYPSILEIHCIDGVRMAKDLLEIHKEKTLDVFMESSYTLRDKCNEDTDITIVFKSGEMLRANISGFYYLYINEELLSEKMLKDEALKYVFKREIDIPKLRLFVRTPQGIEPELFTIETVNVDIESNYNDDIQPFYENLSTCLQSEALRGLHLLYGKPGTGKTNFLRHILIKLNRDAIFIPSGMTDMLSDPLILKLLTDYKGSVLIIEDAEKAIVSREASGNNAVSTLLNISDGLLSDILKMQIICTFNTDISNLDKALLRPGRLLTKYEFKELETEKSKMLANKLGIKRIITKPITLAELYNDKEQEEIALQTRKVVGY